MFKRRVPTTHPCVCKCGREFSSVQQWDGMHGPDMSSPTTAEQVAAKLEAHAETYARDYLDGDHENVPISYYVAQRAWLNAAKFVRENFVQEVKDG